MPSSHIFAAILDKTFPREEGVGEDCDDDDPWWYEEEEEDSIIICICFFFPSVLQRIDYFSWYIQYVKKYSAGKDTIDGNNPKAFFLAWKGQEGTTVRVTLGTLT